MKAKFEIEATIDQLSSLCKTVESMQRSLMCTDRQMCEIILVLEEIVANAILHGGGRMIEIDLVKEWDELVITICDDGRPFDPTMAAAADICRPLEDRCAGGLGIHLVKHYTDTLAYRRENDTNIVTLTKKL